MRAKPAYHRPIRVASVDEEDERLGQCSCGGTWRICGEVVRPAVGTWLDELRLVCGACGERRIVRFDIGSFFSARPGVWTMARGTRAHWPGPAGAAA